MSTQIKRNFFSKKRLLNTLIIPLISILLFSLFPIARGAYEINPESLKEIPLDEKILLFHENTIAPQSKIEIEPRIRTVSLGDGHYYQGYVSEIARTTITGYSSTVDQTNSEPFITASGAWVRDGIVAANFLPFGTKIRIPEAFGDKVFVVKDRMNRRHTNRVDVWFPSRQEAINFGIKYTYIEILE